MNYLIKNATIYDRGGKWDQKKADLLIKRGKIEKIAKKIEADSEKIIEGKNLVLSPGWMDIGTRLTEPGFEDLDDIKTLCASAASGGFTALAVFPNTNPVLDNRGAIETVRFRSADELVKLYPIGALTVGAEGKDIAEMADMMQGGAIAFSDGEHTVQHAGVLKRALRYMSQEKKRIINHPDDKSLSESGIMNESGESAYMGLKGRPALAEEIMLNRDIRLCEYTDSNLLAHMISTREAARLVRKAKQQGLDVAASVSYHNLVASDAHLRDFDPMHKVLPVLRTKSDANALLRAITDDSIDCIVSNHFPVDVEDKKKAFLYASFGALGLEQMFAVLRTYLGDKLPLDVLLHKLSNGPRKVLELPEWHFEEGVEADLTLVDVDREWTFEEKDIRSKSNNAAFLGERLQGKVLGVMANKKAALNPLD
jgi:dihydroorotase